MRRLGVVLGSSLRGGEPESGAWVTLQRHGEGDYVLPHLIDHGANMRALAAAGCDRVLAVGSVGGLRRELAPGSFLCPSDFIAFGASASSFQDERAHRVPGFDSGWRRRVVATWEAGGEEALADGGVYWQAPGPRLETAAEIGLISRHADVIGMTVGSECIAAGEHGLAYAAVCLVDNLANGVGGEALSLEDIYCRKARQPRAAEAGARRGPSPAGGGRGMSLAVAGAKLDGRRVGLRVEDGAIAELGPEVRPGPGDQVVDGDGMALLPGLVNGHTHAGMTLFRGYADDLPLMEWLEQNIWPVEKRMSDDDVYWGTRLACVEMIRTGTTAFWDMYWHAHAVARAVEDAGLRAVAAAPLIDDADPDKSVRACTDADRSLARIAEAGGELARPGFAPHAVYSVSERSLRWVAERAAELGIPVQIHLSETADEVERCVAEHGMRPAPWLDHCGLLGENTVLAHGVFLDEAELELIAERRATVVTNPVANLKLAVGGLFPYLRAREHGVRVGLGTDGPGSNNSLDLLADAKSFALLQKNAASDPAAVTAGETWEIATGRRSPLLGGAPLAVGRPADFLLVRLRSPQLGLGELEAGLVYAASGSIVDTTVVAGRVLMSGGRVDGEEEILAHAVEQARGLGIAAS